MVFPRAPGTGCINNCLFTTSRPGSEPNCRAIAEAVRDAGGKLAFGSDSHTAFTLGDFEHCLRITRAVDFPEDRVLNVTPRRLLDFLEQRTGKQIAELADF